MPVMEHRGKGDRTSYRDSRRPLQDTPVNVAYSSPTRAPAPPNYSKPRPFDRQEQQQATQQTSTRSYKQTDSYGSVGTGEYIGDISSGPVDPPSSPPAQNPNAHRARVKAQVGPWLLGRTLGKGSSGRVRLAKHVETGQFAAIKIVGKGNDGAIGESGQERPLPPGLEREVVIMKLICHPNVMGLWDVWENRGELYLVLEYIEGGELFDYLTRRGRLPEPEAIIYFRQILSGIDYCQHFNICHRDLKPENLLLDSNGNIKIADFGMAALQPHGSLLDTPCGSPHYASPEIVSGKHYDGAKSDIWSCGIILFALLAGYLPFDDDNIRKLLQKVMKGRFVMPVEFSIEAKDLIMRMLTIDPEERISIEEIWKHPLVQMYAPLDPVTGEETDRGPKPPRSRDIGRPVKYRRDIDGEILKNLQTLWQGVEEDTLIERLLNNVHNQEKVFYCLLMKYRYEHLENYPGTSEVRKNSQVSSSSASTHPPQHRISSRGKRAGTVARRGRHRENSGASVTGREAADYRPPTRGKPQAEPVHGDDRVNYHEREKAGDHLHPVRGRHNIADRNRNPVVRPKRVSSRVSATGSIRRHHHVHAGKTNSTSSRYRSRSSLVSHTSASPSLFKSNGHFKRRVSFNHTSSLNNRHARVGESVASKNPLQGTVWVDDERGTRAQAVGFDREDTPRFELGPEIFIPKGRKEGIDTAKRRSAFVNDGMATDRKSIRINQPNQRAYHASEQQDAERRRMVSEELEAACDRAFGSLGSLKTLSTVRSICETGNTTYTSSHTVDSAEFANLTVSSAAATVRTQQSRRDAGDRPLPTLPPEALIRKCSNGRSTLRIFDDDEADPDKGYLDDVLEHFDKLMERPVSLVLPTNQPRAISQGGRPLNLASTNNTIPIPHTVEKGGIAKLGAQNQGLGITRGGVGGKSRVVSAPANRNVSLASRHLNRQSDIPTRVDKFEPAPLRIRPKSVVNRHVPIDRAGDGGRNSKHLSQLPVVKDESAGFDTELILPSAYGGERQSLKLVNEETRAIAAKVNPVMSGALVAPAVNPLAKEVKKKRSFFDVLKGRNKLAPEPKDPVVEEIIVGGTKGTFGRRSGNLLKRWASRDAGGLLAFGASNDRADTQSIANGLTSCFTVPQDSKEGSDSFGGFEEDQFTKVMSQRNWFMKFLNVKPASRVICFNISPMATRKEIMKLWKEWVKYGLVIVEDDRKSLVMRARVGTPNSLNIKEVSFVGEIRAYGGSRKTGSGVVRFTQERGAASSFNRVIGEMAKRFSEKGIILPED